MVIFKFYFSARSALYAREMLIGRKTDFSQILVYIGFRLRGTSWWCSKFTFPRAARSTRARH